MVVVLVVIAVALFAFAFYKIKQYHEVAPELKREEKAYNQLMDYLKAEASYYTGREISEEEILEVGRRYNNSKKRF